MRQARRIFAVSIACAALLGAGYLAFYPFLQLREDKSQAAGVTPSNVAAQRPPASLPLLFADISADEARLANEALPFSTEPLEMAYPLVLRHDAGDEVWRRAETDCLAAAIYYEAGYETLQGQRAVAQVVINRVRHPAFPNSVCEVVFEGSQRATGCQFTFTCDGSLGRRPSRPAWDRARQIALAALSGFVEPSVGMATHYHADYVRPYWAPGLTKISKIGSHIFYRWKGSWGRRAAFNQNLALSGSNYAAVGWMAPGSTSTTPILTSSDLPIGDDVSIPAQSQSGLAIPLVQLPRVQTILEADRSNGTLLADEAAGTLLEDSRQD